MMVGCLFLGGGILRQLTDSQDLRRGDRLIIGIWLGIIVVSLALATLSFWVPLSLGATAGCVLALSVIAMYPFRGWKPDRWAQLQDWWSLVSIKWIVVIQCSVAILLCRTPGWIDSAIYHLGLMKWLNQFGIVPGIALINERFGYTSSWFSFSERTVLAVLCL